MRTTIDRAGRVVIPKELRSALRLSGALAARDAEATLVSLDRRAAQTYKLCGVEARLLVDG